MKYLIPIILLFICSVGYAENPTLALRDGHLRAIVGEAANQGITGMRAVSCAINNRPEGLQGVYGKDSTLWDTEPEWVRQQAIEAYSWARDNPDGCYDLIKGADTFHSYEDPRDTGWYNTMIYTAKVGDFRFYRRLKGIQ